MGRGRGREEGREEEIEGGVTTAIVVWERKVLGQKWIREHRKVLRTRPA